MAHAATNSPYVMLPVAEALEIVLDRAQPLSVEEASLAEAGARVLADDVRAGEPLPPFAASIKDGYAVVASDGPGEYPVIGEVRAGAEAEFTVEAGSVAYITTGAPLPPGADAVVMVEDTEPLKSDRGVRRVRIRRGVQQGHEVRAIGADIEEGQLVLPAGELLGSAEIGLLATVGMASVPVHRRPRVAVLSSGDELVDVASQLGPGQIRDSNRVMLVDAVRAAGAVALDLGVARDEAGDLRRRIEKGLAASDILVTSGGVSMGDLDLIKPLLEEQGTIHFGRIMMKPGKPLTFATIDVRGLTRLVFGLPGNPVSSLVTFYLFVVPALRKMSGWHDPHLPRVQAHLAQPLDLDPERPEYHRACLTWDRNLNGGSGGYTAVSTGSQASSRLLSMRTANALLELPARSGSLPAGEVVDALIVSRTEAQTF